MPFTPAGAFLLSSDGSPASGSAADTLILRYPSISSLLVQKLTGKSEPRILEICQYLDSRDDPREASESYRCNARHELRFIESFPKRPFKDRDQARHTTQPDPG
jgi:hypothetical protein